MNVCFLLTLTHATGCNGSVHKRAWRQPLLLLGGVCLYVWWTSLLCGRVLFVGVVLIMATAGTRFAAACMLRRPRLSSYTLSPNVPVRRWAISAVAADIGGGGGGGFGVGGVVVGGGAMQYACAPLDNSSSKRWCWWW